MDNKKFEQLIDLIINEDEDKARALFHDIVVEKSREIYESMISMDEEMTDSPVEGLLDEISAEEEGMTEEEDEFADIDVDDGDDDMEVDLDADDMGDEGEEGDLEDRVVDLEDKLDELMAEFEELMAKEGGEDHEDMGMDDDQDMMEADDGEESLEESKKKKEEDDEEDDEEEEDDSEDTLEESVTLQKVSVTHGDNGAYVKSPGLNKNTKVSDNGAKPVKFDQGGDSTKGGTQGGLLNPATKDVKGAGSFKNSPGKGNFSEKGEAAPKPKQGDNGDGKSPVAESKKSVKKIIKK